MNECAGEEDEHEFEDELTTTTTTTTTSQALPSSTSSATIASKKPISDEHRNRLERLKQQRVRIQQRLATRETAKRIKQQQQLREQSERLDVANMQDDTKPHSIQHTSDDQPIKRKKLNWRFEAKQRWESKSNM